MRSGAKIYLMTFIEFEICQQMTSTQVEPDIDVRFQFQKLEMLISRKQRVSAKMINDFQYQEFCKIVGF